jgi:hypothetical protein
VSADPSAAERLAELLAERERIRTRVAEVDSQQREATAAAQQASDELIELERKGGRPGAQRSKLEQTLAEARARAAEPWAERIEGARQRARDAHGAVQRFVGEHLTELVESREVNGRIAAQALTDAAQAILAAHAERERVAREIAELCSLVARVSPGDVSYSRAEGLARAAGDLLQAGGEEPPVLQRDPREPRHGLLEDASAA